MSRQLYINQIVSHLKYFRPVLTSQDYQAICEFIKSPEGIKGYKDFLIKNPHTIKQEAKKIEKAGDLANLGIDDVCGWVDSYAMNKKVRTYATTLYLKKFETEEEADNYERL